MTTFVWLLMVYFHSLYCLCSLLTFQYDKFLLRPIGLYSGNNCLSQKIQSLYHWRCAPGYRYNCITGIIIGNPNTGVIETLSFWFGVHEDMSSDMLL